MLPALAAPPSPPRLRACCNKQKERLVWVCWRWYTLVGSYILRLLLYKVYMHKVLLCMIKNWCSNFIRSEISAKMLCKLAAKVNIPYKVYALKQGYANSLRHKMNILFWGPETRDGCELPSFWALEFCLFSRRLSVFTHFSLFPQFPQCCCQFSAALH